jgi:hypothetical protein
MAHLLHVPFLNIRSNRFDSLSSDNAKIPWHRPLTNQSVWDGMSQSRPVCMIHLSQDVRRKQTFQESIEFIIEELFMFGIWNVIVVDN